MFPLGMGYYGNAWGAAAGSCLALRTKRLAPREGVEPHDFKVAGGDYHATPACKAHPEQEGCPNNSQKFITFNNISIILRYFNGKPQHNNRK